MKKAPRSSTTASPDSRGKVYLFLAIALLSFTLGVKAQTTDSTRTPEGRAAELTKKMQTTLALTDDQVAQVQTINLKYAQKNQQIRAGADGRFAKVRTLRSSQNDKDREMKAVLDKDQYKKYKEMQQEMKDKAREVYKNRQE